MRTRSIVLLTLRGVRPGRCRAGAGTDAVRAEGRRREGGRHAARRRAAEDLRGHPRQAQRPGDRRGQRRDQRGARHGRRRRSGRGALEEPDRADREDAGHPGFERAADGHAQPQRTAHDVEDLRGEHLQGRAARQGEAPAGAHRLRDRRVVHQRQPEHHRSRRHIAGGRARTTTARRTRPWRSSCSRRRPASRSPCTTTTRCTPSRWARSTR